MSTVFLTIGRITVKSLKSVVMAATLSLAFVANVGAETETIKSTVVATFGNTKITLEELIKKKNAVRELQAAPLEEVYMDLLQQAVAESLLNEKVAQSNLDQDAQVLKKIDEFKKIAKTQVFIEREVEKRIKDTDLKDLYTQAMKDFKKQKEVNARHILVKDEETAKKVIKELKAGKDFADLAKAYSMDPTTKDKAGDLGFFSKDIAKQTLGDQFADTVFLLKDGSFTTKPVKTKYGFHIVEKVEGRMSTPPKFEDIQPQLKMVKAQEILLKYIEELFNAQQDLKLFDPTGKAIEIKKESQAKDKK